MNLKRWYVTTEQCGTLKIYADSEEKCKDYFKTDTIISIKPCYEFEYLKAIDRIKSNSKLLTSSKTKYGIKEIYETHLSDGKLLIRLYLKNDDYYDIAEYQFKNNTSLVVPITWVMSEPKIIEELFFGQPMEYIRYSYRQYGQPKLAKPKELKGIKQSFSTPFIIHCNSVKATASCFVVDNDIWIKHPDYFSSCFNPSLEDMGVPLNDILKKYFKTEKAYLEKFVYYDCWGAVVLRDEAWICVKNIQPIIYRDECNNAANALYNKMVEQDIIARKNLKSSGEEYKILWKHFYEQLIKDYKKYMEIRSD